MTKIKLEKNLLLAKRAHQYIPGGAHTYSKGDDQFPLNAPRIIDYGKGAYVWDVDGNKFLDLANSLGTTILGHAYEPVLEEVRKELLRGVNFCRPSIIEGELAELVSSIIPCAEMVKFGKNGSDATTAAVKLARAYTGRNLVARCESDPFNSIHDWFIGSTVMNRGVPEVVQQLTVKFKYNDIESCKKLFDQYPNQIACFIFEPVSFEEPKDNFLQKLKDLCEKNGAVLIFDEVVSGFRFALGGAQEMVGVTPHLAAFGKAMANGFSVSALVGQKEFMKLGGIDHNQERVFLLSTTHGGETHSLRAAIKTINIIKDENVIKHFWWFGQTLMNSFNEVSQKYGLKGKAEAFGYGCKPAFVFKDANGNISWEARTLFLQEMVEHNILMPYVVPSYSHNEECIKIATDGFDKTLSVLAKAFSENNFNKYINGPIVKPVFRKIN